MRRSSLFLALACALAGCGDKPSTDADAPTPRDELKLINACLLLTPEEADEAAGKAVDMLASPLDAAIGVDSVKCSYGELGPPLRLVSIEARRLPSTSRARAALAGSEATMRRLAVGKVESVTGLGEAAFWAGGNVQQLIALRNDLLIVVAVELGEESGRKAAAETIARRALERIAANERPPNTARAPAA